MNVMTAIILLDKLLLLAERVPPLYDRFKAIRDELEAIGERELTDAEWEEVGNRSDARLGRLRQKAAND